MRRMLVGAVVGVCMTSGLLALGQAGADPDDSDCPQSTQNPVQLMQQGVQQPGSSNPRIAAKLEAVTFTPGSDGSNDSAPSNTQDLHLNLKTEGCWSAPQATQGPDGSEILQFQQGGSGSVVVSAEVSHAHRDLKDVLDYDRRQILAVPHEDHNGKATSQTDVLEDNTDDYHGHPSWLLRTRITMRATTGQSSVFETTAREIVVAGQNAYLVTIAGTDSATTASGTAGLDPDSADAVYEQVRDGLTVQAQ